MTETSPGLLIQTRTPASQPSHIRAQVAKQAQNPLLEAARPLLQALADTPGELDGNGVAHRHKWLEQEVRVFENICAELRLRSDHVQNARYCLCSALDEAAMQTEWGKGVVTGIEWSLNGLAVAFGQDRQGADRVYRIVEQIMSDPHEHLDLIDVMQNILDLGFKGRYRFEADGHNKLAAVRARVHDAVLTGRAKAPGPVPVTRGDSTDSERKADKAAMERTADAPIRAQNAEPLPRWQIDPWVRPTTTRRTLPWIAIGLLCAVLASYATYEYSTRDTHPKKQTVPSIDALARNLNDRLGSEIAAGTLSLEENDRHTALTLRFNDMFPPGEAAVNAWMKPLIATVGREIAGTTGKAQVVGYTDSLPVGKSGQASNKALSEERAKQVMQILVAAGMPTGRISSVGKGDADPVGRNETSEGRTKNRRVEIIVSE